MTKPSEDKELGELLDKLSSTQFDAGEWTEADSDQEWGTVSNAADAARQAFLAYLDAHYQRSAS